MAKTIRPVDMCIYIDNHIYSGSYDEEKVFKYLQTLFYTFAIKKKYFHSSKDYSEYSIYGATCAYLRLTNPNQFLPEGDPKKLDKIKSVLNFVKSIMYPAKINYQRDNFNVVLNDDIQDGIAEIAEDYLERNVRSSYSELIEVDVTDYLNSIAKITKETIKESPYANDPVTMHRIYLSCLFTLLKSITLNNSNYNKLESKLNSGRRIDSEELLQEMMYEESLSAPTAWHLDDSMKDYINVLTVKIKKLMTKDIRHLIQSYEPSEDILKDMLMAPLSEYNEDKND